LALYAAASPAPFSPGLWLAPPVARLAQRWAKPSTRKYWTTGGASPADATSQSVGV